jgi:hypothetical protein
LKGYVAQLLATCFTLVSCLAYFLTMKMEVPCSSKMLADLQQITWRYIPEDKVFLTMAARTLNPTWLLRFHQSTTVIYI